MRLDGKPEELAVRPSCRRREEMHISQMVGSLKRREQRGSVAGEPHDPQAFLFQTNFADVSRIR
jgi:hypothetical protein